MEREQAENEEYLKLKADFTVEEEGEQTEEDEEVLHYPIIYSVKHYYIYQAKGIQDFIDYIKVCPYNYIC